MRKTKDSICGVEQKPFTQFRNHTWTIRVYIAIVEDHVNQSEAFLHNGDTLTGRAEQAHPYVNLCTDVITVNSQK